MSTSGSWRRACSSPDTALGVSVADLALVDDRPLVGVEDLDGVLDGHDVALAVGVHVVDHRRERRRLARARETGDEHEAVDLGRPGGARHRGVRAPRSWGCPGRTRRRTRPTHPRWRKALTRKRPRPAMPYMKSHSLVAWNRSARPCGMIPAARRSVSEGSTVSKGPSRRRPSTRSRGPRADLHMDVGRPLLDRETQQSGPSPTRRRLRALHRRRGRTACSGARRARTRSLYRPVTITLASLVADRRQSRCVSATAGPGSRPGGAVRRAAHLVVGPDAGRLAGCDHAVVSSAPATSGYDSVLTSAVSHDESPGCSSTPGSWCANASTSSPATSTPPRCLLRLRLQKALRRDRAGVLDLDDVSFDAFWRLGDVGLKDAIERHPDQPVPRRSRRRRARAGVRDHRTRRSSRLPAADRGPSRRPPARVGVTRSWPTPVAGSGGTASTART